MAAGELTVSCQYRSWLPTAAGGCGIRQPEHFARTLPSHGSKKNVDLFGHHSQHVDAVVGVDGPLFVDAGLR